MVIVLFEDGRLNNKLMITHNMRLTRSLNSEVYNLEKDFPFFFH